MNDFRNRLSAFLFFGLVGCTEIRGVTKSPLDSGVVSDTEAAISLKLPNGSRSVTTSNGYVTLGCANDFLSNFCFSVLTNGGVKVREVGDLPKLALPAGGYVVASSIAFLPPNDVVIVGHTSGNLGEVQGGAGDGFVARYSLGGPRVWIKQFGQTTLGSANTNQREDFFDVAVDSTGNIYVAGRTRSHFRATGSDSANAGNYDALLLKLDPNGNLLWRKMNGTVSDEEYRRVVVTAQGQILAAGHSCGNLFEVNAGLTTEAGYNANAACPTENFRDVILSAFSSSGASVYNRQLGKVSLTAGKGTGSDVVFDLNVNSTGEIFMTGTTTSSYGKSLNASFNGETHGGMGDIYVSKLNSNGILQWTRMWGASLAGSSKVDVGKRILPIQETGEILVCAETLGNLLEAQGGGVISGGNPVQGKGDLVLIRLSASGATLGQSQWGNANMGAARASEKETCGSLIKAGTQVVLFGTSDGQIFSNGSGSAFLVRGLASEYELIR
ncbi:MAG: SBBP repeat-containing protein [Bdellovibrionales bacterium]|nr:SBBP repeat-containing protein [Bdellovibrionales bacterium]